MRHLVRGRKLGRTASHRKATLQALSVALIKHERIITTLAKAKALRSYVEPILSRAKKDSTHNRSQVFRHLRDNQATSRLFDEIGPMIAERPGGYTRIVKLGARPGDGTEKALIELVDFNDSQPEKSGKKKRRTRRAGSGGKKKASDAVQESSHTKQPEKTSKADAADQPVEVKPSTPSDQKKKAIEVAKEKASEKSNAETEGELAAEKAEAKKSATKASEKSPEKTKDEKSGDTDKEKAAASKKVDESDDSNKSSGRKAEKLSEESVEQSVSKKKTSKKETKQSSGTVSKESADKKSKMEDTGKPDKTKAKKSGDADSKNS